MFFAVEPHTSGANLRSIFEACSYRPSLACEFARQVCTRSMSYRAR